MTNGRRPTPCEYGLTYLTSRRRCGEDDAAWQSHREVCRDCDLAARDWQPALALFDAAIELTSTSNTATPTPVDKRRAARLRSVAPVCTGLVTAFLVHWALVFSPANPIVDTAMGTIGSRAAERPAAIAAPSVRLDWLAPPPERLMAGIAPNWLRTRRTSRSGRSSPCLAIQPATDVGSVDVRLRGVVACCRDCHVVETASHDNVVWDAAPLRSRQCDLCHVVRSTT